MPCVPCVFVSAVVCLITQFMLRPLSVNQNYCILCASCVCVYLMCVCVCVDQPFSLITWRLYHVAFIISPSHLVCVCAAHCARIIPAELRVCSCTSVESVSSQNTRVGKKVESSTDNSSCSSPSAPLQVRDTCVCVCLSAVCVCVCV